MLGALDLFPIFSYVFLGGKCRFCKEKISPIYPLLELTMGMLFMLSGHFLVDQSLIFSGSLMEIARLGIFLMAAFVTVVFVFYDIRFMEIPDEVILPSLLVLFALLISDTWFGTHIFSHFRSFDVPTKFSPIADGLIASWIIYTFFYFQILIPGSIYAFQEKKLVIIKNLLIEYFIFPFIVFYHLFKKTENIPHEEESKIPAWIG